MLVIRPWPHSVSANHPTYETCSTCHKRIETTIVYAPDGRWTIDLGPIQEHRKECAP